MDNGSRCLRSLGTRYLRPEGRRWNSGLVQGVGWLGQDGGGQLSVVQSGETELGAGKIAILVYQTL